MDAGDIAAWVGVGVAFATGVSALMVSLVQYRQQKRQSLIELEASEASHRQAEAAERRAIAVEDALASALQRLGEIPPRNAIDDGFIRWELQRPGKHLYALRNVGTATARNIEISGLPPVTRNVPEGASARSQEALEFLMVGTMGGAIPHQLWVKWEGQDEPIAVAVPS